MPTLPPTLHTEIVTFLSPRREFRLASARVDLLDPLLSDWNGRSSLPWDAPPHQFFNALVRDTPAPQLIRLLQDGIQGGLEDTEQIAHFCHQIGQWQQTLTQRQAHPNPLTDYRTRIRETLSSDRYQIDSRFVQLTLLIDQGKEAMGIRFTPDQQRRKYNSLHQLLTEVDDQALVLLGGPGSGKTTLLRRLELELAWEGLAEERAPLPFFVPLNAYRSPRPDAYPSPPLDWLAERWQRQHPQLPDFHTLFLAGRLCLLLDGLNELPHRDRDDYEARVGMWQQFVQDAPTNTVLLFSCRSLDYSVPLTSELTPVRQVQVEPLVPGQIEQFLHTYLPEPEADEVWEALHQDRQQLTLFATPFFLRLLVDQKLATGDLLTSRVALLTGFVRRALYREVQERQHRLFKPGDLLTYNDVQQVIHRRFATPTALPSQGVLLPKLERLAFDMQEGRLSDEAGQVRIPEQNALELLEHPAAEEIIAAGIQLNVLDKDLTKLEITYLHQLLQEYFAARQLVQQPDPARLATPWRTDQMPEPLDAWRDDAEISEPLPPAPTTGWEESALLAVGLMPNPEPFINELMPHNLPLAARCAALAEVTVSNRLVRHLQIGLLDRMNNETADLRARIAAAEALAELGDPRYTRHDGPHGPYLLPPLIEIPGGRYPMGDDNGTYDDEKPAHTVMVDPFEIAQFPVTNAEYWLFIEAGGYENDAWWPTEAALAWRKGEASNEGGKNYYRDFVKQLQGMAEERIRQLENMTPDQIDQLIWLRNATPDALEKQREQ